MAVVVIVEGEIAAGKTELVTGLAARLAARGLRVRTALEPVGRWSEVGILRRFYEDPARHGYAFQTFVFATRVQAIRDAFAAPADVYLLERSPATDRVFMEVQRARVDPMEMAMYDAWCDAWGALLPFEPADARVLYLRTDLDQCMARLAARGRGGEGGVTREYQATLRRAHEAFLLGAHAEEFPAMPPCSFADVRVAPPAVADGNFRDPGPERERILDDVEQLLGLDGLQNNFLVAIAADEPAAVQA